jgi:lipoate-protein ligase A
MLAFDKLYFIDTGLNSGSFNMDFDNDLFEKFTNDEIDLPVLRFYSWNEPTLSIGFNQKSEDGPSNFPIVKRITGGQAVFHDVKENELTYSIILKSSLGPKQIYFELGKVFIRFLNNYGLDARVGYKKQGEKDKYRDSFDCFESKTEADIVVNDIKVIGSAQRVKRISNKNDKNQYILQHGSIKLDKIRQLSGKDISYDVSSVDLRNAFKQEFGVDFISVENLNEVFNAKNNIR